VSRQILTLTLQSGGASTLREVGIDDVIVAGWTGRDPAVVEMHIRELEALGVKRPASSPIFYRVSAARLTTGTEIEAVGTHSGGEVEFVLLQHDGRMWVGTGSDHTDRQVEAYGVTVSKQMCDKPLAPVFWAFDEVAAHWDQLKLRAHVEVAAHWDQLKLRAHVVENGERRIYQEGSVTAMIAPLDLIGRNPLPGKGRERLPENTLMFCGTLAAHGGVRPTERFEFEIEDPMLGRKIAHSYSVRVLPVLG
jgi:hypothetical protein